MKLEQQVASLELSKRLKELGVEQESLFYHFGTNKTADDSAVSFLNKATVPDGFIIAQNYLQLSDYPCNRPNGEKYSAFTVAELGELLPHKLDCQSDSINAGWISSQKHIINNEVKWDCCYVGKNIEWSDTEADCRAKMLIYLLENKLV